MPKKISEKLAACIRERGNWSKLEPHNKFDNAVFNPKQTLKDMQIASPKLAKLLDTIADLDARDKKKHGRVFKHFIYSDIKSPFGAKLIAAGLAAAGYNHAYALKKTKKGLSFVIGDNANPGNRFATLTSTPLFGKPIGVTFRRELLKTYNSRPNNVYGDDIRIIVLDSGFREGIDLFDIKYVHLFEPIITSADEKQAIGRATRFCGQKGLHFDPIRGWPLHVYRYETVFTDEVQRHWDVALPEVASPDSFFSLFMYYSNIDPRKLAFANELVSVVRNGTIDKEYTKNVHDFTIVPTEGGADDSKYFWPEVKVENMCDKPPNQSVSFTPTQELIRDTFTHTYDKHGMLLFHSVGTGKTCTAIATASSTFEPEDYSIIYVTRYTLKADVWKNMFDQVCSIVIQDYIKQGKPLPESHAARLRLISKKWFEPMSYRQFSNMLADKSQLYNDIVAINGKKDILKKTLVIVDEAHKLFAADVEGQEKADIDVIRHALHNSYDVSGKDSAKLLLMTATPFTSDPMDMVRLLNLMRRSSDSMPENFEDFADKYLDTVGRFTAVGEKEFQKDIQGQISYLNREKDIRSFAYPVLHEVKIPLSTYELQAHIDAYLSITYDVDDKEKRLISHEDYVKYILPEETERRRKALTVPVDETFNERMLEHKKCVQEGITHNTQDITKNIEIQKAACATDFTKCSQAVKDSLKTDQANAKARHKVDRKADKEEKEAAKKALKIDMDDIKQKSKPLLDACKRDKQACMNDVKTYKNTTLAAVKEAQETAKARCAVLKTRAVENRKEEIMAIKKIITTSIAQNKSYVKRAKDDVKAAQQVAKVHKKELGTLLKNDKSQLAALEGCLSTNGQKVPSMMQNMIDLNLPFVKRDTRNSALSIDKEHVREVYADAVKERNVYFISGHGNETIMAYDKRPVMPQGKILVVFPICSRPQYLTTSCKFIQVFKTEEGRALLKNPVKHKKAIEDMLEHPIRVYQPGDRVPVLANDLFLTFKKKEETILFKSGVFRFNDLHKIDRRVLPQSKGNLGADSCLPYCGAVRSPLNYDAKVHKEIFRGNLYAPAQKARSFKELSNTVYSVSDILSSIGNGVYYYTGCRSATVSDANLHRRILEDSQKAQDDSKRKVDVRITIPIKSKRMRINKKAMTRFTQDIEKFVEPIFSFEKKVPIDWKQQLDTLRTQLEEFPSSSRIVQKHRKTIALAQHVIVGMGNVPSKLRTEMSNGVVTLIEHEVYTLNKVKYKLHDRIYGVIPYGMQSHRYPTCDSMTLAKRIASLYNKSAGVPHKIAVPGDVSQPVFEDLCTAVRTRKHL